MGDFDRCGVETVPAVSVNSNQTNLATTFDRNSIHKLVFAENGWNLSCVNLNQCLYDTKLVEMPNILPEGNVVSAMTNFASESYQLRRYPDTMDFSHVTTNAANFWNYCNTGQMVEKLPSKMVFPNSLTLSCQFSQMGQIYPDTMARFNEDNELTGGWHDGALGQIRDFACHLDGRKSEGGGISLSTHKGIPHLRAMNTEVYFTMR